MAKRKKPSHDYSNPGRVIDIPFHDTTRRRYLNYAISVITSRALPDVRDGLKPVQRRILFTMYSDLHLYPDRKTLKCAKVVGQVLGGYHPHGDSAVYDALVRLAQDWVMRYPLVFGQGNFGSIDGDSPAAYRYTEARLVPLSMRLLDDLGRDTVPFRDTFDGTGREPEVLPAKVPQLLVNGTSGIAVGMATNIPPHNLGEVVEACIALIDRRRLEVADLVKILRGPDFPTGGEILESRSTLRKIYEDGHGTIRMRGPYSVEEGTRGSQKLILTSVPYQVNKAQLVEHIGSLILGRKIPQVTDVRDESTDEVRIVLELKRDADPEMVMAYLYRHTQLQSNFNVNLTCLVPGPGSEVLEPRRLDLKGILGHFIDFRYEVVERRYRHELRLLEERCHILEGFRKIFNDLDEAIRIVRASDGKKDAADKLIARFDLDAIQADAVLETKLYKLSRLEIRSVLDELGEKKRRIREIQGILSSPARLWTRVKRELREIGKEFADARRTRIVVAGREEITYDAEAFIVDEDATVLVSRDGWIRRVQKVTDLAKVRLRQDDELVAVLGGNTRSSVVFFSNFATAYTVRINDLPPAPRGFGDPIQRLFKFRDGERVVDALSLDPRAIGDIGSGDDPDGTVPREHAIALSTSGYGLRFALHPFTEPSTRSGRRFARLKEGEEVVGVSRVTGEEILITASRKGRALLCNVSEINFLAGPGRGVRVVRLGKDDRILGFSISTRPRDGLTVLREGGRKIPILPQSYRVTSRAGKGFEVIKRGRLSGTLRPPLDIPEFLQQETDGRSGRNGGDGHSRRSRGKDS